MVWDTNVLIDYLKYGAAMWEGEDLGVSDEEYLSELEGLLITVNLWTRRDIRFHVLPRTVDDAKGGPSSEQADERSYAVDQLVAALRLDIWGDDGEERASSHGLVDPRQQTLIRSEDRLVKLPAGMDRELVRDALDIGAHVFLTRDKRLLRHADEMKAHRLLLASPLDLVEELAACGALLALLKPETVYWPLPDLQRMVHLINVVGYD